MLAGFFPHSIVKLFARLLHLTVSWANKRASYISTRLYIEVKYITYSKAWRCLFASWRDGWRSRSGTVKDSLLICLVLRATPQLTQVLELWISDPVLSVWVELSAHRPQMRWPEGGLRFATCHSLPQHTTLLKDQDFATFYHVVTCQASSVTCLRALDTTFLGGG